MVLQITYRNQFCKIVPPPLVSHVIPEYVVPHAPTISQAVATKSYKGVRPQFSCTSARVHDQKVRQSCGAGFTKPGEDDWSRSESPRWRATVTTPASPQPFEISSPTPKYLIKRTSTKFARTENRKMSQDRSPAYCPTSPNSLKDINNSLNTTGFRNHNTNFLDHNCNCFNTYNTYCGNVSNTTVINDRSEILTWLSPLKPDLRHYNIQTRRIDSVGEWLLGTEQFRSWRSGGCRDESQKATIFCSGNPGVGKTYIR